MGLMVWFAGVGVGAGTAVSRAVWVGRTDGRVFAGAGVATMATAVAGASSVICVEMAVGIGVLVGGTAVCRPGWVVGAASAGGAVCVAAGAASTTAPALPSTEK